MSLTTFLSLLGMFFILLSCGFFDSCNDKKQPVKKHDDKLKEVESCRSTEENVRSLKLKAQLYFIIGCTLQLPNIICKTILDSKKQTDLTLDYGIILLFSAAIIGYIIWHHKTKVRN